MSARTKYYPEGGIGETKDGRSFGLRSSARDAVAAALRLALSEPCNRRAMGALGPDDPGTIEVTVTYAPEVMPDDRWIRRDAPVENLESAKRMALQSAAGYMRRGGGCRLGLFGS